MFKTNTFDAFAEQLALIHYNRIGSSESFTYRQIQNDSLQMTNCLNRVLSPSELPTQRQFNILIAFGTHSPALLPSIIGIENAFGISCFIDATTSDWPAITHRLRLLRTNLCLCDEGAYKNCDLRHMEMVETLMLSNRKCFLLQQKSLPLELKDIPIDDGNVTNSSRILFGAMTSGTCGAAKVIGVTYKSFWPNVEAFSKLYAVHSDDMIFVSSPATFDPFMIDVALAVSHGATLLTVDPAIRLAPKQLLDVLFPLEHKISIMQTTPSLFMRWTNKEIAERILSPTSSLRVLALGGEAFPSIDTIEHWQNWSSSMPRKQIFNLYGLTEMSCWASAYEVTNDDVQLKRQIPVGKPLDDRTQFELTPTGELLLKTKMRKCFQDAISDSDVLNHETEVTIHTGDVFDRRTDDDELIFKCRTNAIVKVFGRQVDLSNLETIAATVVDVCQVCAVYDAKRQIVIIFVVANDDDASNEIGLMRNNIKIALQTNGVDVICEICCVERMPLSSHGKISKSQLLDIFNAKVMPDGDAGQKSCGVTFVELLTESLGIELIQTDDRENAAKRSKSSIDSSFLSLGGTSLKAMHIFNELERRFHTQFPHLLPQMLDETISIRQIVEDLENFLFQSEDATPSNSVIKIDFVQHRQLWTIDMKKCIDATPSILHVAQDNTIVVSVGSHSKLLYNIRASDGLLISSLELPDRIESQVTQLNETQAIVGCYDGRLYCFEIPTGHICWTFDSCGMIKCKTLIMMNRLAIFGNYNETDNLWCVNANDGTFCWRKRIGTKSIYSNPIRLNDEDFVVCTLDGIIARVNAVNGEMKWTIDQKTPIFSTPSLVNGQRNDFIISATVDGRIGCWDSERQHIWSHDIDGNVFSAINCCTTNGTEEQKTVVDVIFGSHNHHLYCLTFDTIARTCVQRWKCKTNAPIRATPQFLAFRNEKSVLCCSTNGEVSIARCNDGTISYRFNIEGDLFASPAIHESRVLVGSRNNSLYCVELTEAKAMEDERDYNNR